jgi:uncharacterized repeat protein (TIGR03803 family)
LTTLASFGGRDGGAPDAVLVQATNGQFYGATFNNTIFTITPTGTLTLLFTFDGTDGDFPDAGLVQAANGYLYGTTYTGGANNDCQIGGCGTIFKITPRGTLTTVYNFCSQNGCTDGANPTAGLIQANNGDLYGTTQGDGANGTGGTVFKITPGGTLTTLYSFCALPYPCADGANPSGLVQAIDGNFYGTTGNGGANNAGTIFKITPGGTLTTLYSFCAQSGCPDGENPQAALIQANNGNFYGTTGNGGTNGSYGTVFEITPSGALTTIYSFCAQSGCTDGTDPLAALVQGTDGRLYGTTAKGGANGDGTVFKITPSGALTTLHSFGGADGFDPMAGLMQATNGEFYGTTADGGANGFGTVFSLSVGLGPFVETQTTVGKVGAAVKILGTDLTGATSVTFNGTAAVFNVVAPSLITATVPAGATTGTVEVVTPGGTLSSNVPYRVAP